MSSLRRKGRFRNMTELGEALIESGVNAVQLRRQYAQGLIDQGKFLNAEPILMSILDESPGAAREKVEARGLLGRLYKQRYVNGKGPAPERATNMQRALREYLSVYGADPGQLWHGINVVALAARAERDGLQLEGAPDAKETAGGIVAALQKREDEEEEITPWDEATWMEAYVALGDHANALKKARRYVDSDEIDAFELQSTLRQLTEVWQLNDQEPPGNHLLPLLKAELLDKMGGARDINLRTIAQEAKAAERAAEDADFQAILGKTRMLKFGWYRKGLAQCNSVGRIELRDGTGIGTGWLVRAEDFFPGWTGVLVLTNDHVVSVPGDPAKPVYLASIRPGDAQVNFQAVGEVYHVDHIVLSSYYRELDYAFLRLKGAGVPKPPPLVLHDSPVAMADPPPRMYIIGHPKGRDLEISLQDNLLIACNDRLVHYRTPTEPGNSGSPVFEPLDWRVAALHHKGSTALTRIDGQAGTYEANEGISIRAIQAETRKAGLPPPATPPGGDPVEVKPPI